MAEWQKVTISQFLQERTGRFDPQDDAVTGLKRLEKIDFSGEIHLSDKNSKTDMIIIKPSDLVISGINVSKGALAVYNGVEPITATIHYSSYSFNKKMVDFEYFKRFVKSQSFIQALKDQVKGGIKTEIKPKDFLPLEIYLPSIDSQKEIASFFKNIESEMDMLSGEIEDQKRILINLRQTILQEAIEGKLTAKWRKEHPELISGKNHASILLEKIKTEKEKLIKDGKIKKEKPLVLVADNEKLFDLPEGWVWCRLGEVTKSFQNGLATRAGSKGENTVVVRLADIKKYGISLDSPRKLPLSSAEFDKYKLKENDILITRVNGSIDIVGNFNLVAKIDRRVAYCDHLIRMSLFFADTLAPFIFIIEKTKIIRDRVKGEFKTTWPKDDKPTSNKQFYNSIPKSSRAASHC